MHQDNVHSSNAERYYRIAYFNEFLTHCILELKDRFIASSFSGAGLLHLLPSQYCDNTDDNTDVPADLEGC